MCSDVSSVDILVEENDGGLCAAVQELDVEYLQLFHSEYNKKSAYCLVKNFRISSQPSNLLRLRKNNQVTKLRT